MFQPQTIPGAFTGRACELRSLLRPQSEAAIHGCLFAGAKNYFAPSGSPPWRGARPVRNVTGIPMESPVTSYTAYQMILNLSVLTIASV